MGLRARRLAILIGSESALSIPVILGVAITGSLLTFRYSALTPGSTVVSEFASFVVAFILTAGLLLLARRVGMRSGWSHPRVVFVLVALALTSVLRSLVTAVLVDSRLDGRVLDSNLGARTLASLTLTLVIGLILAATAELARERSAATATLLAEQRRLVSLAEGMDADLIRADGELRGRALALLSPTIEEISTLIADEISETAAKQVSQRIVEVVDEVVRPVSRELAFSPLFEPEGLDAEPALPRRLLADRMDVTKAIRPGWLLLVSYGVLLPGPLLLGDQRGVLVLWFALSLVIVLLLLALKWLWPPSLREMSVGVGLTVLLFLYTIINVGFQGLMIRMGWSVGGSALWTDSNELGLVVRIAVAMFVSVLAMLQLHGDQIRANLVETNSQLQELIARIRRETWLLHRSVSLAVHGTVQSALVSTAMRLSVPGRTHATVIDARRRLEQALLAISAAREASGSVDQALEDLRGLWGAVVRIEFEISPGADHLLTGDLGLRECVVEICRETTSNAIRHGRATSVEIRIHVRGDLMVVRVIDNGTGPPTTANPGLGSTMLDDTCLSWSLGRRPNGGSELVAILS